MPDVIKLLSDHVINQIAAGEVIQRPASAVKELMENAVDAGSTKIKLIIKDAGKTLIRVIDNGSGMSDTDARLCFEKHATSKITTADDIFSVTTNGFRGEALASIAAISTVELKTRTADSQTGTLVEIENSKFQKQEPCQSEAGTSISIKNLFFNVPARKTFLKSDQVEFRHIMEEFHRIALSHPEVEFSLFNNDEQLFHIMPGSLKHRIMALFGNTYDQKIVPVTEHTNLVNISGFIGKPEYARKTRGEQYFFVNHRYIKNNYLHHALQSAYTELLAKESYPSYFVFFEIKPGKIDVNIHPTKTEIKFEDESMIYAILKSAVKRALGQHNVVPPMDFDREGAFEISPVKKTDIIRQPQINLNPDYNPFAEEARTVISRQSSVVSRSSLLTTDDLLLTTEKEAGTQVKWHEAWGKEYIVVSADEKLILINQRLAWEKIFFEEASTALQKKESLPSQKELFPQTIQVSAEDAAVITLLLPELKCLGFDINDFGKQTFIIYGIPSGIDSGAAPDFIEGVIENYKNSIESEIKNPANILLAKSYARKMAAKKSKILSQEEQAVLIDRLFRTDSPGIATEGKKVFIEFSPD
ncbi:MAG TPA: DNA mismatch repair endonuclease MutL, partial [Bacteroidia bacterium]|nr:DNA mismatch repair endonuclease MutL [Bacteroidia bacterium]